MSRTPLKNYFFHREHPDTDVEWLRPKDFAHLTLKRPVVIVNGAFDLLHSSHLRALWAARHKAGTLICALDSDVKVRRDKGPQRPIMSFIERAVALNYTPIDYIVEINTKSDMNLLMTYARPDLRVQGYEYRNIPSAYDTRKMLVRDGAIHTTAIIDRILERYGKNSPETDEIL